jgi:hypothetical protein
MKQDYEKKTSQFQKHVMGIHEREKWNGFLKTHNKPLKFMGCFLLSYHK